MSNQGAVAEVDLLLAEAMDCAVENHLRVGADPLLLNLRATAPLNPACVVCGRKTRVDCIWSFRRMAVSPWHIGRPPPGGRASRESFMVGSSARFWTKPCPRRSSPLGMKP